MWYGELDTFSEQGQKRLYSVVILHNELSLLVI